ncbi:MAG: elongation factor-1 alpha [Thiobacillaceae bacterium]|nr:elongation factor-1 alpha [Thiobacillaceae bacterium]
MSKLNYVHFKFLPMSLRVLFTMVLLVFGTGYLMAMFQAYESHAGKDGDPMLSGKDLMIAYSGNPDGTKLETALRGPMQDMLPAEKRQVIFDWLHAGAKQEEFAAKINPILQEHCIACHNPEANPHLPDLREYAGVSKITARDEGMTIPTLVRVSHIHLFSITFIFFITGYIFSHAYVRPTWLKCLVIAIPFAMLITDVASWYLTKVWEGFAWVVIISGAFMGMAFATMWVISMWQMWFWKVPASISDNEGQIPCLHSEQ